MFSGSLQGHRPRGAVHFVLFPDPSSSGSQVLVECTAPGGPCILFTCLVLASQFPRCTVGAQSLVCPLSPLGSWSQAVTFLADVNYPASQEDMVSNWEPGNSLVEDAMSGAKIAADPWLLYASLSVSREGGSYMAAGFLSFGIHSVLSSVSMPGSWWGCRAFHGKVFYFLFLSLWRSHELGCYLTLTPSDCPQSIQARSLCQGLMM